MPAAMYSLTDFTASTLSMNVLSPTTDSIISGPYISISSITQSSTNIPSYLNITVVYNVISPSSSDIYYLTNDQSFSTLANNTTKFFLIKIYLYEFLIVTNLL